MLFYLLLDVLKNEIEVENNILDFLHCFDLRGICQGLGQLIQDSNQLILRIIGVKHRLLRHGDLFRVGNSETEIGAVRCIARGIKPCLPMIIRV